MRAGGIGLIGACDIVVAGPRCTFALTEVRLGLAAAVISVALLPRLDERAAARYYLTGETFDAAEALRIGLVTIATDDVDGAVATHHRDSCCTASPQGLAESKRLTTAASARPSTRDGEAHGGALGAALRLRGGARGHGRVPRATPPSLGRLIQTRTGPRT